MNDLSDFFELVSVGKKSAAPEVPVFVTEAPISDGDVFSESSFNNVETSQTALRSLFVELAALNSNKAERLVEEAKAAERLIEEATAALIRARLDEVEANLAAQANLKSMFAELANIQNKKETVKSVLEPAVVPIAIEPVAVKKPSIVPETIAEQQVDLSKYSRVGLSAHIPLAVPVIDPLDHKLKSVTDKIRLLENSISKVINAGPGSGEVRILRMDDMDTSNLTDGATMVWNAARAKFVFDSAIDIVGIYRTSAA